VTDRSHNVPAAIPSPKPGAAPAARETGWLPDCVYTGDKFEAGLAFFADDLGHITRFSREAADLAAARRLGGQAALPGLVNAHSQAWQRVLRGRAGPADRAAAVQAAARLTPTDLYDAARMAFMEMLLASSTPCTTSRTARPGLSRTSPPTSSCAPRATPASASPSFPPRPGARRQTPPSSAA